MANTAATVIDQISYRLPGNLKGQGPAGLVVGATALYALVLAFIELIGAVDFRLAMGQWFFGGDDSDPLFEAGSGLGFYAALLLALNFILATRWHWMERLFGGAGKVYALHAFAGKTALTFVLLHTGILVVQAMPEWSLVGTYLLPGRDLAYTLGVVGSFGLLALVAVTIWIKLPYRSWQKTHKLMIVPFLGGTLHAIVLQGDVYMIVIAAVGAYAWLDSTFLFQRRATGAVVRSARTFGDIRELVLTADKPMPSTLGKFILLDYSGRRHPFSVSGVGDAKELRLSIRMSGAFTQSLANLDVGHRIRIHGPFGDFGNRIASTPGPQLWVAGGIGITPFLNVLHHLSKAQPDRTIHLLWLVRRPPDAIYREEVERLMRLMPSASFTVHDSTSQGRFDFERLDASKPKSVFICGPDHMMDQLEQRLLRKGMRANQIISERFKHR